MKISINKSAKRVLSIALALIILVGTLFTINITINVSAETTNIAYWNGTTDTSLSGSGTAEEPFLITNAEELAALAQGKLDMTKHYKVSGASAFYMVPEDFKDTLDSLSTVDEIASLLSSEDITAWACGGTFQGVLDGNGATIYGMAVKGDVANGGLFSTARGATVKNLGIEKSYISTTNNAGAIFGQGSWSRDDTTTYSPTVTISSCVVKDCYIMATNSRGGLMGNAGYSGLVIDNCLVADNFIGKSGTADLYPAFVAGSDSNIGGTINVPAIISNSIGIGIIPKAGDVNSASHKEVVNCYSSHSMTYSVDNVQLTSNLSVASLKGITAKTTAATLNWATDTQNGEGYWHISANDYPTPIKPDGWKDIVVMPVWDGTAATAFAGGSGTEEDPYIIKTAEQLYKMVKDGGREADGTEVVKVILSDATKEVTSYRPCYYKVADGVSDLYLNNVQGGDIDTLKSLVSAGNAKNWTQNFNASTIKTADKDGDGYLDEDYAFVGVFDGNGVTIHGLYSTNNDTTYTDGGWSSCPGIGFVPALAGNAIIKNVDFDKAYIYSTKNWAAVVTTSFGLDETLSASAFEALDVTANVEYQTNDSGKVVLDNDGDGNYTNTVSCGKYVANGDNNVSLYNVSVRNSSIVSTAANTNTYVGSCGGLVSSHSSPSKAVFVNCLFDGYSSELSAVNDTSANHTGGIFSCGSGGYGYRLVNCVSLGAYPMPNDANIPFSYMKNIGFTNTYTDVVSVNSKEYILGQPTEVSVKSAYEQSDMPALNWSQWSLVKVEDGRTIPMPTGVTTANYAGMYSLKDIVMENLGGSGNVNLLGVVADGEYGHYHHLIGSGTQDDPYLISTAQQLATAISTGGINTTQKLHYKLTNDIDLYGLEWIDIKEEGYTDSNNEFVCLYRYIPFVGTLDGDGYAIYGLNANDAGALIPELAGGTVKNLHLRNSAANTALIAASVTADSTIDGCSAESCYVEGGNKLTGTCSDGVTIKTTNSYYDDTYYLADGTTGTPTLDGTVWYGVTGDSPRLVNRAKAMPCADINGDGEGYEYAAADLAALRNHLLGKSGYEYAYADASSNGKVNISDLIILTRSISDTYNKVEDGFWRNVALGKISIYYGENDNYDAARKLELYLESVIPGLDIQKVVATSKATVSGSDSNKNAVYVHANDTTGQTDGNLEIIVGDIDNGTVYANTLADNAYAITYDSQNGVLWLQGENFTAVEQAVLDFIEKSDVNTSFVYTVDSANLSDENDEKLPVTINGTPYYYAWGDEFGSTALSEDTWTYGGFQTESDSAESKYLNLEAARNQDFDKLYDVDDGKLTIKRGVYNGTSTAADWGYVNLNNGTVPAGSISGKKGTIETDDVYVSAGDISAERSLLVKQGYFEFKASLPSDGHSFASWWMLGAASGGNNNGYTDSLYGKVYKLNKYYDGTSNSLDSSNPATYKYQLPNSTFEIDIVELMQDISCFEYTRKRPLTGTEYQWFAPLYYSHTGGIYEYELPLNIHKFFKVGASNQKYYTIDWSSYTGGVNPNTTYYTVDNSDNNTDGIFSSERPVKYDFGTNDTYDYYNTNGIGYDYIEASHNALTAMRRYGFEWKVVTDDNGVGQSFSYTLYIYDLDGDGIEEGDDDTYVSDPITDITYNESTNLSALDTALSDAVIANQYMYFLIDNIYYASNQHYNASGSSSSTTVKQFEDLLDSNDGKDKTTMEVEYLRVYQAEGRRDIITPETETFNNGNHFGY